MTHTCVCTYINQNYIANTNSRRPKDGESDDVVGTLGSNGILKSSRPFPLGRPEKLGGIN